MKKTIVFILTSLFLFASCANAEKKEMKSADILKLIKKGKPVQIVDKIILDDLDFSQANEPFLADAGIIQTEVKSNVFFSNCVFMGKVTAAGTRKQADVQTVFRNNVVFLDCDFRQDVDFRGAIVFGNVNFSRSTFRKPATFNNISVWSKSSYFNEVTAEQAFTMVYASFFGNLSLLDAKFQKKANFQEIKVNGKLMVNNTVFSENADFSLINVLDRALFNYVVFEKNATFLQANFSKTAEFMNAAFNGTADFEDAYFAAPLKKDGLKPENIDFSKAFFVRK
ncbi:MAG: pentapeptide repeat-containing protein [Prevotellaceae bacterium]|jgi:hypothetical protein|nr:pentapeptide repeat-containing protein [Prevotellaceae bacterium]